MSEGAIGIIVLCVTAIVVSLIVHTFIRRIMLATVVSATIATILFQVLAYLHAGYLDPFFLIAVVVGWCWDCLIAFVIGIPFWLVRKPRSRGHCRRCGYDLTGNVFGVCPECGTPI